MLIMALTCTRPPIRRTNYPNVRGDLTNPEVRRLAESFGSEIIINGKGPAGAFRREACTAGCPTIIMEGGEVWKVEPGIVESATRGDQERTSQSGNARRPGGKS